MSCTIFLWGPLLVLALNSQLIAGQQDDLHYPIPNPFKPEQKGFYEIRSRTATISSTIKKKISDQLDYFSLSEGLSFSLVKDQSDSSRSYAIIGDGPRGRTYIVRNPAADENEELDCELDHEHHHRQVFPFQYVYNAPASGGKKKKGKMKSNKWSIYGVGAIWLNAIERKLVSQTVNLDMSFNLWCLDEGDLSIKLFFQPTKNSTTSNFGDIQKAVDQTRLTSLNIGRTVTPMLDPERGHSTAKEMAYDNIKVESFESEVDTDSEQLQRFFSQLNKCREHTKGQRLFPSLLRAVSLSPDRLYHITYLQQKFNSISELDSSFGEQYHRNPQNVESHSEWFSFEKEMQVNVYEGIPEYPDPKGQIHVFMKKFTEREGPESSRHTTVQYHVIESEENEIVSCKRGEDDPPPDWLHLLLRPIHFRRSSGVVLTGQLTGLGALLMNAADIHYKHYSLYRRFISIPYDISDLKTRSRVATDEWHLLDPKSKRLIQFYFKRKKRSRDTHSIDDLLRVEVRESAEENSGLYSGMVPVNDNSDSDDSTRDYDLLVRWDILEVKTQAISEEKEFIFTKPAICESKEADELDKKKQQEEDDHDDQLDNDPEEEWQFERDHYHDIPSDGEGDENPKEDHETQEEGENFEMEEPGEMVEDTQVPDFFDFMEGQSGYSLHSNLIFLKKGNTRSKQIYLDEQMDLTKNLFHLSVYSSNTQLGFNQPDLEYFINYNARAMFKVKADGACQQVYQLEPWLRILSSQVTYYRTNPDHNVIEEEDKLRMYGVAALWRRAAESEDDTWFLGAEKEPITDAGGHKHRELVWNLHEDEDYNMRFLIKFWLKLDKEMRKPRDGYSERPIALKSIELNNLMDDPNYEGGFQTFDLDVGLFEPLNGSLTLPAQCQDILKQSAKEDHFSQVKFPTFDTCIYSSKAYTVSYKVITAPRNVLPTTTNKSMISVTLIKESFDTIMNLGHLIIGEDADRKEVFIDGSNKLMYLLSSSQCKRISSLKGLVDEDTNFLAANEEFSLEKMYGLAALWIRLQNLKHYHMTTVKLHDEAGDPYRRYVYETSDKLVHSDMKTVAIKVKAVFVMHNVGQTQNQRFELESINFSPEHKNPAKHQKPLHRTNIEVVSMNTDYSGVTWELPSECLSGGGGDSSGDSSTQQPATPKFPLWKDVIAATGQFYARSEMTVSVPMLGEGKKIYLMDEWLYGGDLRFKSYGLRQNYDFLVYTQTKEAFDFSTDYRCSNELPKMDPSLYRSGNSLMEFWTFNRTFVNSLAELYYAPLSLWRLADANLENIKLITSFELAPKPKPNQSKLDAVGRELREDTWQVSNPLATWSYDMHFEKHSMVDPGTKELREWYTLSRISVRDVGSVINNLSLKREVDIDIINYRYLHDLNNWKDLFLLPEGYGCQRSDEVEKELAKNADSLFLDPHMPHLIMYEAALEKVIRNDGDTELGPVVSSKIVLPTLMGTVFKAPSMELWADYPTTRYLNGTKVSNKIVHDKTSSLSFEIDRLTGYCKIGHIEDRVWSLEFPDEVDKAVQVVIMDDDLLQLLLNVQTRPAHPLNRFISNGKEVTVYEESLNKMKLTQQLEGPVSIVRRFEHSWGSTLPTISSGGKNNKLHRTMAVQVMLFDSTRSKLEAVLNFNIRQVGNIALHNFVNGIDVSNCYNDGDGKTDNRLRTFTIEYQCSNPSQNSRTFESTLVEESFTANLLTKANLLPTQLSGAPLMNFHPDKGIISFTFNLLNAPTAIEFSSHFENGKRMNSKLESMSEVKLSPNLWDCSKWCDQVNCLAMTYCRDHTCRVLADTDQSKKNPMTTGLDLIDDLGCTFWRMFPKRPTTTDKFAGELDTFINSFDSESARVKSLYKLDTRKYCQSLNPWRFYEVMDNFEFAQEDDLEDEHMKDSYKTIRIDYQLQLEKVTKEADLDNFKTSLEHAMSYSQCLEVCKQKDCVLVSYCRKDNLCSIITGSGDLKKFDKFIEASANNSSCSITARNLLDKYTLFSAFSKPTIFERKLEAYDDLNCAAMCDAVNEFTCLSFDVCLSCQPEGPPKPTCYLQSQHVIQDSFDRSILMPNPQGDEEASTSPNQGISCKHYSKSILADYKQIINRQFLAPKDKQTVKGNTAERCAHECQDDQKCYGFEHCFDSKSKPSQSCYFVRSSDNFKPDNLNHLYRYMQDQSAPSDKCSIYAIRHFPEEYGIDNNKPFAWVENTKGFLGRSKTHVTRLAPIMKVLYYVMGSIVVGLLIQLAYIKASGRPITYR